MLRRRRALLLGCCLQDVPPSLAAFACLHNSTYSSNRLSAAARFSVMTLHQGYSSPNTETAPRCCRYKTTIPCPALQQLKPAQAEPRSTPSFCQLSTPWCLPLWPRKLHIPNCSVRWLHKRILSLVACLRIKARFRGNQAVQYLNLGSFHTLQQRCTKLLSCALRDNNSFQTHVSCTATAHLQQRDDADPDAQADARVALRHVAILVAPHFATYTQRNCCVKTTCSYVLVWYDTGCLQENV